MSHEAKKTAAGEEMTREEIWPRLYPQLLNREELKKALVTYHGYRGTARALGVSEYAVRREMKRHGLARFNVLNKTD